jgi:glycosyltransferase involved in cell wall biosynthesis
VIVVDDGSTDHSDVLAATPAGHPRSQGERRDASTYNAAFPLSRGEVVVFMDADDVLLPAATAEAVQLFRGAGVAKVHWPLYEIDEHGRRTGNAIPDRPLPEGDFREATITGGPDSYLSPPTTGNAWSRAFLQDVLPEPEAEYRRQGEMYLVTLAPVFGAVRRVAEPLGLYRMHGQNDYACRPAAEKNRMNLELYQRRCLSLAKYLDTKGVHVAPEAWQDRNPYFAWMHRLARATEELSALLPIGCSVILADEDQWADRWGEAASWRAPFHPSSSATGNTGGPPDDDVAIRELDRLRRAGASFIVFGWPAFWWLDHYAGLHLRSNFLRPRE